MMRAAALAGALLLIGCGPSKPAAGDDGHAFERQTWFRPTVTIEFTVHPSLGDLRKAAAARGVHPEGEDELIAWAAISRDPAQPCRVHIVDPRVEPRRRFIGHEVLHCIYGEWHD